MPNNPKSSPTVSSTIGLKNMVIAPLTEDTEETLTYGELQLVAGAIEASVTPDNADPQIQYADDIEFDTLYPDPQLSFKTKMADIPLTIQEMIFGNRIDENGVLIRTSTDKPPYFAVGFKSEKSNHKYRQTGEVEWTAMKRTNDSRYQAVADEDENGFTAEKAAAFLQSVYSPSFASAGG